MIQFNLLPDVKIEYLKTRYRKRLLIAVSAIVTAAFLGIFIILFLFVRVNQKIHLKNLDKDIKTQTSEIKKTPDLDKILTIQNQLNSLPGLHDKKIVASRLVDYLNKVTPAGTTISDLNINFETNVIYIKGNASNLVVVNKYTDTLKYTDFKVNGKSLLTGKEESGRAFKNVVLSAFSLPNAESTGAGAQSSYTINAEFMPAIFAQVTDSNGSEAVTLTVPSITSTSSEIQKPSVFKSQPNTEGGR